MQLTYWKFINLLSLWPKMQIKAVLIRQLWRTGQLADNKCSSVIESLSICCRWDRRCVNGIWSSSYCSDPFLWLQTTPNPGSLWEKTNVVCDCCYIILLFGVWFCSFCKVKNVHLLFAELVLLWHKPTLHDVGIVVFPPKRPDVRHGDSSQLSRSLIGQIRVSQPSSRIPFTHLRSQVVVYRDRLAASYHP